MLISVKGKKYICLLHVTYLSKIRVYEKLVSHTLVLSNPSLYLHIQK